jgi:hypothetical protein
MNAPFPFPVLEGLAISRSRGYLKNIAVLVAGLHLRRMREIGLVSKISDDKKSDEDIDICQPEKVEIVQMVNEIEAIAKKIIFASLFTEEDEIFIKKQSSKMVDIFFRGELLKKGVSPELFFCCVIYMRFCDDINIIEADRQGDFAALSEINIWDHVFARLEDSVVFDMDAHVASVNEMIEKGVGHNRIVDRKSVINSLAVKKQQWAVANPLVAAVVADRFKL